MWRMPEVRILSTVERAKRRAEVAGRRNMLLLTHFRWFAVVGQLATILIVRFGLDVSLPIVPMIAVLAGLVVLNLATTALLARRHAIANWELFLALLADFAALSAELYMSGGATNPFAPIGLLQVVLGAVLLEAWSSWVFAALQSIAFGLLALVHRPLVLPLEHMSSLAPIHIFASWLNFVLVAVLLVFFVTRISRNLRMHDASLAEMRQHAAEEDHIVRMGLLASGAAHELGTPLSSIAVILGDWRKRPDFAADRLALEDVGEMQAAVARCKEIVVGILNASGEARSEGLERMTLRKFVNSVADQWMAQRPGLLIVEDRLDVNPMIVADRTLAQIVTNVLENAAEAGASIVELTAETEGDDLVLTVRDDGCGFPKEMLAALGTPYQSSKNRRGAGLGLFLAVNVMRKLGGGVHVRNGTTKGAVVTLSVPLDALALQDADD